MDKETKLTIIIILFSFSIILLIEKSYQSISPTIEEKNYNNNHEKNNNNNYGSDVQIIEKIFDRESKNEIEFEGGEEEQDEVKDQVQIKTSELNNHIDGRLRIANEIKDIQ